MTRPVFTYDETYLINAVRSTMSSAVSNYPMLAYLLSSLAIAIMAAHYGSIPGMFVAFIVLCGMRIYEEHVTAKWTAIWRSILDKYEAALQENETSPRQ